MIKVNSKAKIISGQNAGWFVWVQNDSENTGGYLVIQSPEAEFSEIGFDNWFLTLDEIEKYFADNNWVLMWID